MFNAALIGLDQKTTDLRDRARPRGAKAALGGFGGSRLLRPGVGSWDRRHARRKAMTQEGPQPLHRLAGLEERALRGEVCPEAATPPAWRPTPAAWARSTSRARASTGPRPPPTCAPRAAAVAQVGVERRRQRLHWVRIASVLALEGAGLGRGLRVDTRLRAHRCARARPGRSTARCAPRRRRLARVTDRDRERDRQSAARRSHRLRPPAGSAP